MAAGGDSVSASRELVVPRRPSKAIPFNEKDFFYCSRVLRRARKQAASGDGTGRFPASVSTEEVAALAIRCQQLEWAAAVAHYNAAQLHERVSKLEAAGEMPPLPLPVPSPEAQPVEQAAQVISAPASAASAEVAWRDDAEERSATCGSFGGRRRGGVYDAEGRAEEEKEEGEEERVGGRRTDGCRRRRVDYEGTRS